MAFKFNLRRYRLANTTFYDRRRDVLQWRLEWVFHSGTGAGGGGGVPSASEGGGVSRGRSEA